MFWKQFLVFFLTPFCNILLSHWLYLYSGRSRKLKTTWFFLFISQKNYFFYNKKRRLAWGGLWPSTLLRFWCSWSWQPASWAYCPQEITGSPCHLSSGVEWIRPLGNLHSSRSRRQNNRIFLKFSAPPLEIGMCNCVSKKNSLWWHNHWGCNNYKCMFHFLPRRLYWERSSNWSSSCSRWRVSSKLATYGTGSTSWAQRWSSPSQAGQ